MWGIWGSYYDIPKAIFYLLKGDYRVLGFAGLRVNVCTFYKPAPGAMLQVESAWREQLEKRNLEADHCFKACWGFVWKRWIYYVEVR